MYIYFSFTTWVRLYLGKNKIRGQREFWGKKESEDIFENILRPTAVWVNKKC